MFVIYFKYDVVWPNLLLSFLLLVSIKNHGLHNYRVNHWNPSSRILFLDKCLVLLTIASFLFWTIQIRCNKSVMGFLFIHLCITWFLICTYWKTHPVMVSWIHGIGLHAIPCVGLAYLLNECKGSKIVS